MNADKLKAEFEKRQARAQVLNKQVEPETLDFVYPTRILIAETDAGKITLKDLQSVARDKGIKYTGLKKVDLIKVLSDGR